MREIKESDIHSQLTYLKEKSGMTLDEISRQSGVPKSTVQRVLAADDPHCSLVYILAIAHSMGGTVYLSCPYDEQEGLSEDAKQDSTSAILQDYGATVQRLSDITDTLQKHNRQLTWAVIVTVALLIIRMIVDILLHAH